MSSYKELLAQRETLEKQIKEAKEKEFAAIVSEIKQKIADYGVTLADLGFGRAKQAKPRQPVAPKYRDPLSGAEWSGRGKPPKWIAGKNYGQYLIER